MSPGTETAPGRSRSSRSRREKVPVVIVEQHDDFARIIAGRIAEIIREKAGRGERPVLGLATGSTPIEVYRELIRLHREEGLDFSNVVTFNLDEYYPMEPESIHSFRRFMDENLFHGINIDPQNINFPRGNVPREEVEEECAQYEEAIRAAGGIDFQILGIGKTGHVGFNEPGSGFESRTRVIALDTLTRRDAAPDFFGEENVPIEAITMGVATILEAREIALLATGEHKAAIIRRAVEGAISPDVAATYLQEHPHATFYLDDAAAAELTRVKTPWVVGEVSWDRDLEIRAVIWLSEVTGKSVLKLDALAYREHHLSSLLARYGTPGALNGEVFNALLSKIRGKSRLPAQKRVIVFDHEVHRYLDFLRRFGRDFDMDGSPIATIVQETEQWMRARQPGEVDTPAVQKVKKSIREAEAVSGIETFGMKREQARFLNLPFYQTGKVRKDPIGPADVKITLDLLEEHRPEYVFVAGDLSDPHGTHRMSLQAVHQALEQYSGEQPEVWYYRGAWQEWSIAEADVLVPMSEDELRMKILAIFKHQSQKDRAPFPGHDDREFWQRVEERNRSTAASLDRLGLPEYFAMESYVVRKGGEALVQRTLATAELAARPRRRSTDRKS
jgi:glucosamine-6-phosphate deaminase